MIDSARIEANWHAIQIELDAPVPSRVERILRRLGLSAGTARIVAATPALRRSWFGALGLVMVVALGAADASRPADSIVPFLILAPIVPMLGVTLSYGTVSDPLHELTLATPMRGLRLVLLRTFAVVAVSIPLLSITALASPAPITTALSWLLPSLATTSANVALLTRTTPRRGAAIVALTWLAIVAIVAAASSDRLTLFGPGGQIMALVATAIAGVVVHQRRQRLDLLLVGDPA